MLLAVSVGACHAIFPYGPGREDSATGRDLGDATRRDGDLALRDGPADGRPRLDGRVDGGPPRTCSATWCWENPLPHGNRLYGVWAHGPSDIYAVGEAGTILRYDGQSWSSQQIALSSTWLFGVWGSTAQDIYVVGEYWRAFRGDGTSWKQIAIPGTPPSPDDALNAVWGSGPNDVFIVGDSGAMFRFDGTSWSYHPIASSGVHLLAVGGQGETSPVYAAGVKSGTASVGVVYKWTRGQPGAWSPEALPATPAGALRGLWVHPTSGDVFVVGDDSSWKKSSTGWTKLTVPPSRRLSAVWGDGSNVFAVEDSRWNDDQADLLKLGGTQWMTVGSTKATREIHSVWGVGQELVLVGAGATVVRWQNSFTLEHPTFSRTSRTLKAVWGMGPDVAIAVGENGTILRRGSTGWTSETPASSTANLNAVWGPAGSPLLVAVGDDGAILHYEGSTWVKKASPTSAILEAVWGTSETDIWAVGDVAYNDSVPSQNGWPAIVHYDGTWSWAQAPAGAKGLWLDAVWGANGEVYATGQKALILVNKTKGAQWETILPTQPPVDPPSFLGMWGTSSSDICLGAAWERGLWHLDASTKSLFEASGAHHFWGSVHFAWGEGTNLLAAGDYGQVHRRTGTTWSVEDTACGNSLYGIWTSGNVAYAVGESGTILRAVLPP